MGISTDTLALQQKFTKKNNLTFPLYADTDLKAARAFGVLMPKRKMAKRATFVINKQGNIAMIYDPVKNAGAHPEEVLEYVKSHLAPKK